MRRHKRFAVAVAALASLGAVLVAPMASGQANESMLSVRGIDGTDRDAVAVTFLYTGRTQDLESMTVRENGAVKSVDDLTNLRRTDQRLAVAYAVDVSASMADDSALVEVKRTLTEAVDRLPQGDEMAIVSFSDAAVVETGFTSDTAQLTEAIDAMAVPEDGGRAVWDGMRRATGLFASRPDLQPNLVVITDGADDASRATAEEARASVVTSGAALFTIELEHQGGVDSSAFRTIMDRTGGAAFPAAQGEVADAVQDLTATLQSQYVATFASSERQGQVDVSLTIGNVERRASYVAGAAVQGAAAGEVVPPPSAFGPEWLRSRAGGALGLVLVGLAVGLGVYAVVSLATRTDESLNAVLRPYDEGGMGAAEDYDGALAQTALLQRAVEITEDFAERQGFLVKVEHALERADLPLRAAEAMFFYAAGAVLLAALAFTVGGPTVGFGLLLLALMVPPAAVNFLATLRAKKFEESLPDTLQLLSGSLRAGYSLLQGVEAVSKEVADPMGKELRRVITEARLGREVEDAMDAAAERMASPDFAWAVMAIRIQREVGGNLSELLLTVADTMVHRERLRRDIAALTAEGKISAIILGLLPIGLGAFMWMSNPTYMSPLASTGLGHILLILATVSGLIGFVWMKKIIAIKI